MSGDLTQEELAERRFAIMGAARIGSLIAVMIGIAGSQNVLPLPYPVSVVLAVGAMISFFFLPPVLAKRWKAQDRAAEADAAQGGDAE